MPVRGYLSDDFWDIIGTLKTYFIIGALNITSLNGRIKWAYLISLTVI